MKRVARLGFALGAGLVAGPAFAREAPALERQLVDVWQESAGLPQRFVLAILQTRDGYLWLGTRGGLARFDGVRFTVYDDRQPDQLRESEVWTLAEGADASLWIGTLGGGLTRLKDGAFTTYTTRDGLPSDLVLSLSVAADGTLWIATSRGLVRLQGGHFTTFTTRDGLPDDNVQRLHTDGDGVLWIATNHGLASLRDGHFVRHRLATAGAQGPARGPALKSSRDEVPAGEPSVGAMASDGSGGLWAAVWEANHGAGLRRLKDGVVTAFTTRNGLPSDSVKVLLPDSTGTLWIGTADGLCRYRNGRFERLRAGVASQSSQGRTAGVDVRQIQSLYVDREENLWIGTRADGLVRMRAGLFLNVTGRERDAAVEVRSVLQDSRGAVWLGTDQDLRRMDGTGTSILRLPGDEGADALAEDASGDLWVGTARGLLRLHDGRFSPAPLPALATGSVYVLFRDTKGDLWVGTGSDGLYRRSAAGWTRFGPEQGLLGDEVRAVAEDHAGGLWIGTRNGGVSLLREGRFTSYGPAQGLPSPAAQAILVDPEDGVWVATRRGLVRIRGGRLATITAHHGGLPVNYFYQIVADDHSALWLTHARGIVRAPLSELNAVADGRARAVDPLQFGVESGVPSTALAVGHQPAAWKTRDGRLWFATGRGAAVVDPAWLGRRALPPPVRIEELRVDQRLVAPSAGGPVECLPGDGNVEIRYTGLSFVTPTRVRFKYLLEGFDGEWQDAETRRVAYYTNLPPAEYRFRVLALNDGVPSEREASLSFRLRPHWYQSRAWYALVALTALALAAGGARHLVTRRFRRRVQELERQQALDRDRARIAKDIHDDLGAGLTRISLLSELAQREPLAESAEHMRAISTTARELTRAMDEIVWAINSRNDTLDGLTSYLCRFAQGYLGIAGVRCRLDVPTELPAIPLPAEVRHNLFLAVKEALHNVVKHAQAREVALQLRLDGRVLHVVVEDDGRGLACDGRPGQGLANMERRLSSLGGECAIESAPGRGTRVQLTAALPPAP